jgi:transposase
MACKYKRKCGNRRYRDYTAEKLKEALDSVRQGMPKAVAAELYGISLRTLYNKLNAIKNGDTELKMQRSPSRQLVFSAEEETRFCNNLLASSDFGFPIDRMDL